MANVYYRLKLLADPADRHPAGASVASLMRPQQPTTTMWFIQAYRRSFAGVQLAWAPSLVLASVTRLLPREPDKRQSNSSFACLPSALPLRYLAATCTSGEGTFRLLGTRGRHYNGHMNQATIVRELTVMHNDASGVLS
jgi:hypothetical protein